VKDQFTLSDRKFRPATGAREFPILGMARPNAFGWSVVDDQRTARDYRAARSCRKYRIGRFGWWQHAHVQFSCAFRMAASQELTVRRLVVESLTCPWQSMFPICPRKRSGHSKVAQSTVSEKGGHRAPHLGYSRLGSMARLLKIAHLRQNGKQDTCHITELQRPI
jgi:hypothetical protein